MNMINIVAVRTEDQATSVREMAWEFIDWLRERYPDLHEAIDEYLINQKFEEQLENILVCFSPPDGECLMAYLDDKPVGILMLKPKDEGICEMNRMFVRQAARGRGVARGLCQRLIEISRERGYKAMVLSTLDLHHEALGLYRSLGFTEDIRAPDAQQSADRQVQLRLEL